MSARILERLRDPTPVTRLLAAGVSRHQVMVAVQRGVLFRVRRGWVAPADADPALVDAVRGGVVLSCVTQAKRIGLWDVGDPAVHSAASPHAGRVSAGGIVHWGRPAVPRPPGALVDALENVLVIAARCQPREVALAIWNSALNARMVEIETLRRLPLPPSARELLDEATPFADSGLESIAVPRLRWLNVPLRRQIWIGGHRVDLLIGDRLILQIDGGHHVGPQRTRDIEHDARLVLMGYHVIRVGYDQMVHRWPEVQDLVMRAVAQGLHRSR